MKKEKNSPKRVRARAWILTVPALWGGEGDPEKAYTREELLECLRGFTRWRGQLERGLGEAEEETPLDEAASPTEETPEGVLPAETPGFLHWQVVVYAANPLDFHAVRAKFERPVIVDGKKEMRCQAHIERVRDLPAAVAYCSKETSRVDGEPPLIKGTFDRVKQGRRSDLAQLHEDIVTSSISYGEAILSSTTAARHARMVQGLVAARDAAHYGQQLRDVEVSVFWGATGTGKTSAVYEAHGFEEVYRTTHYGSGAFDGYVPGQHEILCLDEFSGQLPIEQMLVLLDIYPTRLPARYADKYASYTTVYILSNVSPTSWYPTAPPAQRAALMRRLHHIRRF